MPIAKIGSQFDVCGVPMRIAFGTSGTVPLIFMPTIRIIRQPKARESFPTKAGAFGGMVGADIFCFLRRARESRLTRLKFNHTAFMSGKGLIQVYPSSHSRAESLAPAFPPC